MTLIGHHSSMLLVYHKRNDKHINVTCFFAFWPVW